MNTTLKFSLVVIAMLGALSACTIVDRKDYLEGSNQGRPLQVPAGLALPQSNGQFNVPKAGAGQASPAAAVPTCTCQQAASSGKDRPMDMPPEMVLPQGESQNVAAKSGEGTTSATYSDYARRGMASASGCACLPRAAAAPVAAHAPVDSVKVAWSADGRSIHINEPFGRCWHRVGQALDRTDLRVMDMDRSKGVYYLKDDVQLRVQGKRTVPSCNVSIVDRRGAQSDDAQRQTRVLYKALAK